MKAYVFPGQGAQFEGMGKDLFEASDLARNLMEKANEVLGYRITDVMFHGSAEELKQTNITQPALYIHSVVKALLAADEFQPDAVAGHSLGEFSALAASGALSFEDGLKLVHQRAVAMQKACEAVPGTMAAVLGLADDIVEEICAGVPDVVVPANYNCPGQLVISGTIAGVEEAAQRCIAAGGKATMLVVGGAFHSPLMQPAKLELEAAIQATPLLSPRCPIYQNVHASPETNPAIIKENLINQLTAPVRWTATMQHLIRDGFTQMIEVGGTGKVLQGMMKRLDRSFPTAAF
jgi:[acyl-carrier-protein] S-malonyltransferase